MLYLATAGNTLNNFMEWVTFAVVVVMYFKFRSSINQALSGHAFTKWLWKSIVWSVALTAAWVVFSALVLH